MSDDEIKRFLQALEKTDMLLSVGNFHSATRAWGYMFFAFALAQKGMSETLTRERWLEMAGLIHDQVHRALSEGLPS